MNLVRTIDSHGPRQAIARAVIQACDDLGIEVIAEGVETPEEYHWFRRRGVRLHQGYLFGRPAFRELLQYRPAE
jgi:EAL domain-containing protein (putative c-di-GMP-specific phosphodiesterase class I)